MTMVQLETPEISESKAAPSLRRFHFAIWPTRINEIGGQSSHVRYCVIGLAESFNLVVRRCYVDFAMFYRTAEY